MRLLEYQSKAIFSDYGIPIPTGFITSNAFHAQKISSQFKGNVVLKAQVHMRGRGKKGGIRLVKDLNEVETAAMEMLGMRINGSGVNKILVEEAVNIEREFLLSMSIDFENQCPIFSVSKSPANSNPAEFYSQEIDLLFGPQDFQIRNAAIFMEIESNMWEQFIYIVRSIWKIFSEEDAQVIDVRPLVLTAEKELIILDARIDIDDLALACHPEIYEIYDTGIDDEIEIKSRKYGIQFIHDHGEIACLTVGKGLAAALYDHFQSVCGLDAAIIDMGKAASEEKIQASLDLVQKKNKIKAIFIHIFCEIIPEKSYFEEILSTKWVHKMKIPIFAIVNIPKSEDFLSEKTYENITIIDSMDAGIREICKTIQTDQ